MATVPVGNAGNANDTTTNSPYGAVAYNYNIGTYDVTLTQYTAFLNSVASTDTYGLYYDLSLGTNMNVAGISRSGSPGSYTYSVIGDGQRPVTYVSWYSAIRFANWLTDGTTESGAYTISNGGNNSGTVTVPTTAQRAAWSHGNSTYWYIPDENEWYKAAYYDPTIPGANKYWLFPTRSNAYPSADVPPGGSNSANFYGTNGYALTQSTSRISTQNYLTDVGAYSNSPSYYGTFDQGGDVGQFNDLDPDVASMSRGYRGGAWFGDVTNLDALLRFTTPADLSHVFETNTLGFRVAAAGPVPEPASIAILLAGGLCLLGYRWRRRKRPA
jgi:formylglycine-generating enzyme required for sulfatase activity